MRSNVSSPKTIVIVLVSLFTSWKFIFRPPAAHQQHTTVIFCLNHLSRSARPPKLLGGLCGGGVLCIT